MKRIEFSTRNDWWTSRKCFAFLITPELWIDYDNDDEYGTTLTIGFDWFFWGAQVWIEL